MYYVAVAGVINVVLDYVLIGPFCMGAKGAALATVISQAISVILAFFSLKKQSTELDVKSSDLKFEPKTIRFILSVGVPIALQDGLIQISFLIITAIANSRGVDVAAAVGIVEKIIGFLFLVPSAMLSTVSALSAQNAGAGKHDRSREVLKFGVMMCVGFGMVVFIICQFISPQIVSLFVNNNGRVAQLGGQYLKAYSRARRLPCIRSVPCNIVSHGPGGSSGFSPVGSDLRDPFPVRTELLEIIYLICNCETSKETLYSAFP